MDQRQIEQLIEEALDELRCGNHVGALALTDQLVVAAGEDPAVRVIRAEALLRADAGLEALDEARLAAELDPDNPHAQTVLGLSAWRAGRLALAQESLERAVELSGRKPGVMADYAWFMASERGPRLAEQAANEAVVANHKSSTAWAALGLAQFRLHRRLAAGASLKRALELDPNDPYAQSVMVKLLHEQRDDANAAALAELLEETPGTRELVEEVRKEAKRRQIEKKLIEREAVPDPARHESPRLFWLWLMTTAIMISGLFLLIQPSSPESIVLCAVVPLAMFWWIRRFFN